MGEAENKSDIADKMRRSIAKLKRGESGGGSEMTETDKAEQKKIEDAGGEFGGEEKPE